MVQNLHREFHERIDEMQRCNGLRIWILHVLHEHGPKNGVEIMDALETHYEGIEKIRLEYQELSQEHRGYCQRERRRDRAPKRPSPGSVYPMLKKMVDEDLIIKRKDGRYELAEKGQKIIRKLFGHPFFRQHEKQVDHGSLAIENVLTELDSYVSYLEDIKKEKILPYQESIDLLSEKLKRINESLKEE